MGFIKSYCNRSLLDGNVLSLRLEVGWFLKVLYVYKYDFLFDF